MLRTLFKVVLIPRNLEIPYKLLDLTLLNNFYENKFNQIIIIIMWSYPIIILNTLNLKKLNVKMNNRLLI